VKIGVFVGRNEIGGKMFSKIGHKTDFFVYDEFRSGDMALLDGSDVIFLLWWSHIISPEILAIPSIGFVNLHPSYLPHCRGKDPYFWSIVEGVPFGLTIHFVDDGIDTGDILFQKMIPVSLEDTGESLYRKAAELAPTFLYDKFDDIVTGNYIRKPQDLNEGSRHYKGEMDEHCERLVTDIDVLRARSFPMFDDGAKICRYGECYKVIVDIRKVENGQE